MKTLTLKYPWFSPIQLLDEKGKLLGEILLNAIAGFREKIKVNNRIFNIQYNNLVSRNYKIFDDKKDLILESDIAKDRLIYFGNETEIFYYKSCKWFSDKVDLYRNDTIVLSVDINGLLKTKYTIKIDECLDNYIIVLAFINFYINSRSS